MNLLRQLMWMMGIITLVLVPPILYLSHMDVSGQSYDIHSYSLGNLGGAQTLCNHAVMRNPFIGLKPQVGGHKFNHQKSTIHLECLQGEAIISTDVIAVNT